MATKKRTKKERDALIEQRRDKRAEARALRKLQPAPRPLLISRVVDGQFQVNGEKQKLSFLLKDKGAKLEAAIEKMRAEAGDKK